jgi:hypothetical protein
MRTPGTGKVRDEILSGYFARGGAGNRGVTGTPRAEPVVERHDIEYIDHADPKSGPSTISTSREMLMAKPELTKPAQFPAKLHKKKGFKDPVKIEGKNISVGDTVNINGTQGQKPTTWVGKITKDNTGGKFDAEVEVDHLEERKDESNRGMEDVSVTVTNSEATSDPVTTPNAPVIP